MDEMQSYADFWQRVSKRLHCDPTVSNCVLNWISNAEKSSHEWDAVEDLLFSNGYVPSKEKTKPFILHFFEQKSESIEATREGSGLPPCWYDQQGRNENIYNMYALQDMVLVLPREVLEMNKGKWERFRNENPNSNVINIPTTGTSMSWLEFAGYFGDLKQDGEVQSPACRYSARLKPAPDACIGANRFEQVNRLFTSFFNPGRSELIDLMPLKKFFQNNSKDSLVKSVSKRCRAAILAQ